jgi:flagella basal body P-ring formation protein FlgA
MMLLASMALAGCLGVAPGSNRILAGDLAPSFPELAGVPAETPLGAAPAPGVVRTFHIAELRALAKRLGIAGFPQSDICVQRPVAPLDPARLLEAMRRQLPDARLHIVEFSRQPAPAGEIEFPLSGLHYAAPESLWTGSVRFGDNSRFTIWARVIVLESAPRVLAVGDLEAGRPIAAGQLLVQMRDGLAAPGVFARSIEEVAGKCPRVAIRAGAEIRAALLENVKEVLRGDTVRVEVRSGAAYLDFEARAETSGAVGQTVLVRNPLSQKQFRALVEAPGKVRVVPEGAPSAQVNP